LRCELLPRPTGVVAVLTRNWVKTASLALLPPKRLKSTGKELTVGSAVCHPHVG
jgi:hypothetical protein